MKKVFLLLAAAFSGFAVMAGGVFTYNATTGVIEVPYNSYGDDRDATPDGKSDQWLYSGPKHTTSRERFCRRRKSECSFRSAHWK